MRKIVCSDYRNGTDLGIDEEDLAGVSKVATAGITRSPTSLHVEELKRVLVRLEHHATVLLNSDLELAVGSTLSLKPVYVRASIN